MSLPFPAAEEPDPQVAEDARRLFAGGTDANRRRGRLSNG